MTSQTRLFWTFDMSNETGLFEMYYKVKKTFRKKFSQIVMCFVFVFGFAFLNFVFAFGFGFGFCFCFRF